MADIEGVGMRVRSCSKFNGTYLSTTVYCMKVPEHNCHGNKTMYY